MTKEEAEGRIKAANDADSFLNSIQYSLDEAEAYYAGAFGAEAAGDPDKDLDKVDEPAARAWLMLQHALNQVQALLTENRDHIAAEFALDADELRGEF